ncbi:MAG: NusA-like transcription termination signal-binding factor [Candidatus Aenigmarchaeota archaeon]|nr:NusA-like transcription termination signal-binding factor [Candidatus Aenigmarchaeota archaeon]
MMKMSLVFDTEAIHLITLFENVTGAPVKDCVVDNTTNTVYFVIEEGKVGTAIGKNGNSVKNAERIIGKNIKLFEFSKDISGFIKKLIPQAVEIKIRNENGRITAEVKIEKKDKALVIGRDGRNIKILKELLHRNHQVNDLVVR